MKGKSAQGARRMRLRRSAKPSDQTPCRHAFDAAQERRKRFPLSSGLYKLRETREHFDKFDKTFDDIAAHLKGRGLNCPGMLLGNHCTTEDKAHWLKGLPKGLAHDLGYNVMPAVSALSGDSVSKARVDSLVIHTYQQADAIVMDCENIHAIIGKSIQCEYNAMRSGDSMILPLAIKIQTLIDFIVEEAQAAHILVQA